MSNAARGVALLGLFVCGCPAEEDDGGTGEPQETDASSTNPTGSSAGATTQSMDDTSSTGAGEVSSGEAEGSESGSSGGSTSEGESGSSGSGGEVVYDPEFVWVADFLRANCVKCHATNANGNLLLPTADITNEEVRIALEGVVATTGLLLVEPGDREASQTWLQITNEFGAIFPVEDTDRFGAWIDAGAMYYAE